MGRAGNQINAEANALTTHVVHIIKGGWEGVSRAESSGRKHVFVVKTTEANAERAGVVSSLALSAEMHPVWNV